jgi:hypothetical protein
LVSGRDTGYDIARDYMPAVHFSYSTLMYNIVSRLPRASYPLRDSTDFTDYSVGGGV